MPYGIPREEIPWYPTIDYDTCVGCQECFGFCQNGVYAWDDNDHHPVVVNPYQCVVGCSACAQLCPMGAIRFPTREEMIALMRELMERYRSGVQR
ncbi:MAG: 4Fe-4S dicluster domain-containing protein [Anaerolineae bacterium]